MYLKYNRYKVIVVAAVRRVHAVHYSYGIKELRSRTDNGVQGSLLLTCQTAYAR